MMYQSPRINSRLGIFVLLKSPGQNVEYLHRKITEICATVTKTVTYVAKTIKLRFVRR